MDEKRLLEIFSAIDEIDEPFVILTILTSLHDNELLEIIRILNKDSKKELDFYKAIKNIAHTYVESKPKLDKNSIYENLGFQKGTGNYENTWNSDYTAMLLNDFSEDLLSSSKKNR